MTILEAIQLLQADPSILEDKTIPITDTRFSKEPTKATYLAAHYKFTSILIPIIHIANDVMRKMEKEKRDLNHR
jgi:hypothetical protein